MSLLTLVNNSGKFSGTDIFGFDPLEPSYLSLMYATGPGHKAASWTPLGEQGLGEKDFAFPSTVYRSSAAHQGEEVRSNSHGVCDTHLYTRRAGKGWPDELGFLYFYILRHSVRTRYEKCMNV